MSTPAKHDVVRVFFALSPDADCARRLFAVAGDLAARLGGRSTARDSLHLTLAFVGEVGVDRLPELLAAAGAVASDDACAAGAVVLDRLHCRRSGKMLWATSDRCPARLALLADRLRSALLARGFVLESRAFVAHVTLLRGVKVVANDDDLAALNHSLDEAPVVFAYRGFVLLHSRPGVGGSSYERLGAWDLRGD